MKGISKVVEEIVILRWMLNRLVRVMAMKKERAVICGIEVWEQELANAVNDLTDAVNAALEKEGRPGMKLTGRLELTEWEQTERRNDDRD